MVHNLLGLGYLPIYVQVLFDQQACICIALYEISVLGWIEETTKPMVEGIVNAIVRAHDHLQEGSVTVSRGELLDSNISRSPAAYLLNPKEERDEYKYNVDKDMTLLGFRDTDGNGLGLVNWFVLLFDKIIHRNSCNLSFLKGLLYMVSQSIIPIAWSMVTTRVMLLMLQKNTTILENLEAEDPL